MTVQELYKLASYANTTFGMPEVPAERRRVALRVRLIGRCPGCARHENEKWWTHCPFEDCPSHGVMVAAPRPTASTSTIEEE
jgi:hypothetical protein